MLHARCRQRHFINMYTLPCTTTNITNYEVMAWNTIQYAGKTWGRTIFRCKIILAAVVKKIRYVKHVLAISFYSEWERMVDRAANNWILSRLELLTIGERFFRHSWRNSCIIKGLTNLEMGKQTLRYDNSVGWAKGWANKNKTTEKMLSLIIGRTHSLFTEH